MKFWKIKEIGFEDVDNEAILDEDKYKTDQCSFSRTENGFNSFKKRRFDEWNTYFFLNTFLCKY